MIFDLLAFIIPKSSITLDGIEYTEIVDVRRIVGEHEIIGEFRFTQMQTEDYLIQKWDAVINEKKMSAVHEKEAIDAYTVELIEAGFL